FVTLKIYDINSRIVRTLDVGYRIAATYESPSKALHWDGNNDLGEPVASGIYFYTLTAGDYSATRKMIVLK
ncbi:T9SS type A sorting domain-containing protein, partial [Candidatus Poribacteria bacterium]|nr:T9SS type A sorting domain-containing protein [Candidatus Poribacteria bacterium]